MRSSRFGSSQRSHAYRHTLLVLALGLTASAPARGGDDHQYVGVKKCNTCHGKELMGDQVATWRKGPHTRAFATLTDEASQQIANERGITRPPQEAQECLRCHSTVFGVTPTQMAYDLALSDGVQCESCHGPGRDYRKKKIMSDRDNAVAKGLWDPNALLCARCHNEASPTFDPARYTLPDGSHAGFDYDQAVARIAHEIPAEVRGHYIELEKKQKEAERKRREAGG